MGVTIALHSFLCHDRIAITTLKVLAGLGKNYTIVVKTFNITEYLVYLNQPYLFCRYASINTTIYYYNYLLQKLQTNSHFSGWGPENS